MMMMMMSPSDASEARGAEVVAPRRVKRSRSGVQPLTLPEAFPSGSNDQSAHENTQPAHLEEVTQMEEAERLAGAEQATRQRRPLKRLGPAVVPLGVLLTQSDSPAPLANDIEPARDQSLLTGNDCAAQSVPPLQCTDADENSVPLPWEAEDGGFLLVLAAETVVLGMAGQPSQPGRLEPRAWHRQRTPRSNA
jgi:hypothetical protein